MEKIIGIYKHAGKARKYVFEDYFQVLHPKSANVCHSRGVAEKVGCIFGLDRLTQELGMHTANS